MTATEPNEYASAAQADQSELHRGGWGRLVLLRHGQTAWSVSGQHTGWSDIPLTSEGERQAVAAGERLRAAFPDGFEPANVHVSVLQRARSTAALAGFGDNRPTEAIKEWDYGRAEGRTRQEIQAGAGFAWDVWADGPTALPAAMSGERDVALPDGTVIHVVNGAGESLDDAAARARRAIEAVMPTLATGVDVLFVAHAHILRILTTQWLGVEPAFAKHLKLDTAHYSVLGMYKGEPVIEAWNC